MRRITNLLAKNKINDSEFASLDNISSEIQSQLNSKADQSDLVNKVDIISGKQLSTEDYSTAEKNALANKVDKISGKQLSTEDYTTAEKNALANKVDKISGKQLSTEDYSTADKTKLSGAPTKEEIQNCALIYAVGSGSASAITCTLSPVPSSWSAIGKFLVKVPANNTGALTVNPNSLGARTVKKLYNVDLVADDIKANQIIELWNDGTNLQLLSPISNVSSAGAIILTAIKPLMETVTNSTTLQDDDHLSLNVSANTAYLFEIEITFLTDSNSQEIKTNIVKPSSSFYWSKTEPCLGSPGAWPFYFDWTSDGSRSLGLYSAYGNYYYSIRATGYLMCYSAGTVKLQWCLNRGSGSITMHPGSYLKLTKVN